MAFIEANGNLLFVAVQDKVKIIEVTGENPPNLLQSFELHKDLENCPVTNESALDHIKACPSEALCLAVSKSGRFLVVCSADKIAFVYQKQSSGLYEPYAGRPYIFFQKASNAVVFDDGEERIVVADRSGCVTSFVLDPTLIATESTKEITAFGEPNEYGGQALTGSVSMILALEINKNQLITSDRDEKIKVVTYPEAYNIEHILMGHTKYIKTLKVINLEKDYLLSGGGDGNLILWDLETGKSVCTSCLKQGPIRKIHVSPISKTAFEVVVLFEEKQSSLSQTFEQKNGMWTHELATEINLGECNILDSILAHGKMLWLLSSKGLKAFDLGSHLQSSAISENLLDEEMKNLLLLSKDVLPADSLFKNTDSTNIEAYQKRKCDRIEKKAAKKAKKSS